MDTPAFRDSLRLPRTKRFGTFCFAGLLSNTGTWAQQVAQPWLLLSLGAPRRWILPHAAAHGIRAASIGGPHLLGGVREVIDAPRLRVDLTRPQTACD